MAAPAAFAQVPDAGGTGGQPFTIDANDSLEYRQQERVYIAKGRAKVTRNGASVTADTLTAYERDKPGGAKAVAPAAPSAGLGGNGNSEIWKFEASGHVVIENGATEPGKKATAYGDHATYDIDSGVAILTGHDLHLDQAADRITARDSFEYNTNDKVATARGDAKAVRQPQPGDANANGGGARTVTADTLRVIFTEDQTGGAKNTSQNIGKGAGKPNGATGSLAADHMEAEGHVRITQAAAPGAKSGNDNPNTVATSDKALFDNKGNSATLLGHVQIARGPSQLEGDRAELDFTSGVSRLLTDGNGNSSAAAPQDGASPSSAQAAPKGRIHGLLVPGQGLKTTQDKQP